MNIVLNFTEFTPPDPLSEQFWKITDNVYQDAGRTLSQNIKKTDDKIVVFHQFKGMNCNCNLRKPLPLYK